MLFRSLPVPSRRGLPAWRGPADPRGAPRPAEPACPAGARLYGENPADGIGGAGAFFLLLDQPEVYGLPPDPVVTTRDLPRMWWHAAAATAGLAVAAAAACLGRRG